MKPKNIWRRTLAYLLTATLLAAGQSAQAFLVQLPLCIADPDHPDCTEHAVIFVPGLKGSRLYMQGAVFENKLWEPNRNADVEKLFLDENGNSIEPGIYTRDIINEAFGFNIYKSFRRFLGQLAADDTIGTVRTFAYDWRQPNSAHTQRFITMLEGLVVNNHNVTIITHSNGALVAKAALQELVSQESELLDSIDRIIYVAAPHHGTPSAIAAALHGYDQQLLGGIILKAETARELAEHMPSAFTLFPTQSYFTQVLDPVISFDESVEQLGVFNDPASITSPAALQNFLTGGSEARPEPAAEDTHIPNVIDSRFINNAASAHEAYADPNLPDNIEVINIIGWGLDTLKGIRYHAEPSSTCEDRDELFCRNGYELDMRPEFTNEGDKTVITLDVESDNTYYMNLFLRNSKQTLNIGGVRDNSHGNILEILEIQQLIANILEGNTDVPEFITTERPIGTDEDKRLRVSVHSPVALSIKDEHGNHTGPIPNPSSESDLQLIEKQIPNSYYFELGEGKYAGTNLDTQQTITLQGTGIGTFDLELEEVHGNEVVNETTFRNVPVTPNTTAELEIVPGSSDKILEVDIDGDGEPDAALTGGQQRESRQLLLAALRAAIEELDSRRLNRRALEARLNVVERFIERGREHIAIKMLEGIERQIDRVARRSDLPPNTIQEIRDIINALISQLRT